MALPQLTNADAKKKGDLIALIDDESVERITTKISDVFSKINLENTSSFVSKLSENLVDKFDIFKNMEVLLKDISGLITKSNELFSGQFKKQDEKDQRNEFNDQEEKEDKEDKKPKKPKDKEKEDGKFKKLLSSVADITKMGLFDPEAIGKVVVGSLLASSVGKAITSVAKFSTSMKGLGLVGAGFAVGNEAINSYNETAEYMTKTNNEAIPAMLGRFFGGSGKNSIADKFAHYSKWAGMGAMAGIVGGPFGMFAGALLGGALGFVADYLGADFIADKFSIIGDKIQSGLNIFDPKDYEIDTKEIQQKIDKSKEIIKSNIDQIAKNDELLSSLQNQLLDAKKKGDFELSKSIQNKIDSLLDSNRRLQSDSITEQQKIDSKLKEIETVSKKSLGRKIESWLHDIGALSDLDVQTIDNSIEIGKIVGKFADDSLNTLVNGAESFFKVIGESVKNVYDGLVKWFKDHMNIGKLLGFDKSEENKNAVDLGKTVGSLVQPPKNQITEATKQINVGQITPKTKSITEKAKEANIGQHFPMPMIIPTGPNITNTDARSSTNIQNVHPSRPSSYDTNFSGFSRGE